MSVKGRGGKPFTIENLIADNACEPGLKFVTPIIERGGDVALELKAAGFANWITWAIVEGYDCSSAWRDMDGSGNSFTWHDDGWIFATAGCCGTAKAGDYGTARAGGEGNATAGYKGTATAGLGGTATAGYKGTAAAGDYGIASAGFGGTATVGDGGTATAGESGTAAAGDCGIASAGFGGTATVGDGGTATAGESGTATAGDYGIATVAEEGKASAGIGGVVCIQFYDGENYRIRCAEVDGVTIKPNTFYKLDDHGEFVEVEE